MGLIDSLKTCDIYIAVGSVDSVAATAAIRRAVGKPIQVIFTQVFEVKNITEEVIQKWDPSRKVGLISLGVNNSDPQMTKDFVKRIHDKGHEILFVADKGGAEEWQDILGDKYSSLLIKPKKSEEKIPSTCAVLRESFAGAIDEHTDDLLKAGNDGNKGNFETHFGSLINQAIKSNMADPTRRPYLAEHFAKTREPDDKINVWIQEYTEIQKWQPEIIKNRVDLGDGIFLFDGTVGRHDATSLMMSQYKSETKKDGANLVVLRTTAFIGGKLVPVVAIGTNNESWDLKEHFKGFKGSLGGFEKRMNFEPEFEAAAIAHARTLLKPV